MNLTYFLKQFSLFSTLSVEVIQNYFGLLDKVYFDGGDVIIDYNDNVDYLYIILSGNVSVSVKDAAGNDCVVDRLKAGDVFGEMTILSNDTQPLMVRADGGIEVLKLGKDKLSELLNSYPSLNKKFYQILTRRLHHMYSKKQKKESSSVGRLELTAEVNSSILNRKENELAFLDDIHDIIASNDPFKIKLKKITKGIAKFYDVDMCLLYLYEKDNRYIKLYAANDYKNVYASSYRLSQNDDIVRWIKEKKTTLLITEPHSVTDDQPLLSTQLPFGITYKDIFIHSKFLSTPGFKDLLFVPLIEDEEVVGMLTLLSRDIKFYEDEDKRFLEIVTGNFIGIIRKEQFDYEASLRTIELDTLKKIGEAAHSKPSLKELLSYIIEHVISAMNAKMCTLRLHDPESGILKIESKAGLDESEYETVKMGIEKFIKKTVINIGEYVIINDVLNTKRFSDDAKAMVTSLISVPFVLHDKVIGMLTVYDKNEDALIDIFDQNDLRLLTAIATHTAILIENARLYDEIAYSQSGSKVQLKVATEIIGESFRAKQINAKIKKMSQNSDPVLILGEVGIGKNFAARCIHFSSNRMAYHFIIEDCMNFEDKLHGADLFGRKSGKDKGEDVRGIIEQAHDGTLALRHVEVLSKDVQKKLLDFLKTKEYTKVNGKRVRRSDVKIIFQSNVDIAKLVENDRFDPDLFELISKQTLKLPPLRERKKDLPLIIDHFLKVINAKLQKNVTNISDNAMGMLMSYNWPGNLMELYNVLERGVLVASKDTILSEQIFLGIPRAEGDKTYNILRDDRIARFLKSKWYPALFQAISVFLFFVIIYFSFFSPAEGEQNLSVILSWVIGWPLIFISYILLGRIFCTICPFSTISKFVQRFFSLGDKRPESIKRYGNVIAVTFCFVIIWYEEVTNIYTSAGATGFLVLFIFALTLITSILYERMVWCRYLCPWGMFNGLFAMASVLELRSNRHICLTQCKTNVCYEGSDEVPGCPMYEHPYSMESNKNCTLCANCIKNCPNSSIQLNLRLVADELWIKAHPHRSESILGIALAFLFVLKMVLEIKSVEEFVFFGYDRFSLYGGLIYTALFLLTVLLSVGVLYLINLSMRPLHEKHIGKVSENTGYAFIPLALSGFLSYFLEPLLLKGRALVHAVNNLLFDTPFPETVAPIISHITLTNVQVVFILFGGVASAYSSYKIVSRKFALLERETPYFYKMPAVWVITILTAMYLALI